MKKEGKRSLLSRIFWALVVNFIVIISMMLGLGRIPVLRKYFVPLMFASWITFSLLGIILIVLTVKQKIKGMLKIFLILTGASAAGFFVSILLHNLVYGLLIYWFGADFWTQIGGDEPVFFFIAVLVCPIAFLVGVTGSIVLFMRKIKQKKK